MRGDGLPLPDCASWNSGRGPVRRRLFFGAASFRPGLKAEPFSETSRSYLCWHKLALSGSTKCDKHRLYARGMTQSPFQRGKNGGIGRNRKALISMRLRKRGWGGSSICGLLGRDSGNCFSGPWCTGAPLGDVAASGNGNSYWGGATCASSSRLDACSRHRGSAPSSSRATPKRRR